MTVRFAPLAAAAAAALLAATGAQAAVSVLGGGPASLCFQAADTGAAPLDYLVYCNEALAGALSDTDRAATYINRGVLKLSMKSTDEAAEDFRAGLKIDDKLGEGYVDLAATEITHKRFADAIADIDKGLALGTKEPQAAYFDRGIAFEALGNLPHAYDDYRQALTIAPDFAPAAREIARFKVIDRTDGS